MKHNLKVFGARLAALGLGLLLVACGGEGDGAAGGDSTSASSASTTAATEAPAAETVVASSEEVQSDATSAEVQASGVRGDVIMGDPNAPVTIIEYASMTCPHCARFNSDTVAKLKDTYIAEGKVKYIFRHFVMNQPDLAASTIARCGTEDQYFAMIDLFFDRQRDWANQQFVDELAKLSRRAGLSRARFDQCLADRDLQKHIVQMGQDGDEEYDITATPTIIVNGEKQGTEAQSYEVLVELIESEL